MDEQQDSQTPSAEPPRHDATPAEHRTAVAQSNAPHEFADASHEFFGTPHEYADAQTAPSRTRSGVAAALVKAALCLASTLTLLGGALALQQTRRAPARREPPAAQSPRPAARATGRDTDQVGRPVSEPYKGTLSIFEDPERAGKLQIERVMDVLKIGEGSGVADIGAGSGWFTVRAARRAGPSGTIYAVEINPEYLRHIEERAKAEGLSNVRAVLGREDDPLLPEKSADAVLLLKTYHEIAEPVRLMRNLRRSLRPGALVGVIDRNGRGDDHGLDAAVVTRELARAGYALVAQHDFVKPDGMDYFLVFRAKD